MQGWANSYAGFSLDFALAAINYLKKDNDDIFLDPFVGSGTSAVAAAITGVQLIGIDLDPFSALLTRCKYAINFQTKKVDYYLERSNSHQDLMFSEEANEIFNYGDLQYVANVFNRIKTEMQNLGEDPWKVLLSDSRGLYDSEVVALSVVVIASRGAAKLIRGSNPVWLRKSVEGELAERPALIGISGQVKKMIINDLSAERNNYTLKDLMVINTDFLNDGSVNKKVDSIITSPPYLNRLDYVMSHLPEISIMSGFTSIDIQNLRCKMMGTTKMSGKAKAEEDWGEICNILLDKIRNHPSKASATYYFRFYCQYFDNLSSTLRKMRSVVSVGGQALMVVQNSYYKDVPIPLYEIISEMGKSINISVSNLRNQRVETHMGSMNPTQRAYVAQKVLEESVILMKFE